jgi:hypothetical protein
VLPPKTPKEKYKDTTSNIEYKDMNQNSL